MNKYIILICTALIGFNSSAQRRPPRDAKPFNNIEEASEFINAQSEKGLFSGTVLVIKNNEILLKEAYGLANKENNSPIKIDTKINIGSINKAFTSASITQLIEAGKLSLEDKVVKYIPELKMEMADEITVKHLLQMESGFASYWDNQEFLNNRNKLRDMEDYLPIIAKQELSFKPGTNRQYSNSGYELLGILVQRVSGKNYYEYVRENIYQRAGMINTDVYDRDKSTTNLAQGYSQYNAGEWPGMEIPEDRRNKFIHNNNDRLSVRGTAAGGGYSTVDDLLKYLIALKGNQLFSKKLTDLYLNRFEKRSERNQLYRVAGGSAGINAMISADLENNNFIIVLSNYDPPTASDLAARLEATIR